MYLLWIHQQFHLASQQLKMWFSNQLTPRELKSKHFKQLSQTSFQNNAHSALYWMLFVTGSGISYLI